MSTHLGLFYSWRLENCVHCTFIFTISVLFLKSFFSSSSCRAARTDILHPLLPLLPIVHRFWQVLRVTSRILTELLYVRAGRPAFARPCEGVHTCTSFMSSFLLRLTMRFSVMGGRWPYSCCFVGHYLQDLFNIARSILV